MEESTQNMTVNTRTLTYPSFLSLSSATSKDPANDPAQQVCSERTIKITFYFTFVPRLYAPTAVPQLCPARLPNCHSYKLYFVAIDVLKLFLCEYVVLSVEIIRRLNVAMQFRIFSNDLSLAKFLALHTTINLLCLLSRYHHINLDL